MEPCLESLIMRLLLWKVEQWCRTRLTDFLRYGVGGATRATLNDIRILHRSSHFVVVDKKFDVLINSDDSDVKVTVENQLKALLPDEVNNKLAHSFHFVHRIDYPTSGVLCLALNKKAAAQAAKAFSNRKTKKYYIALLRGHVAQELVDISLPIGEDTRIEHQKHRMCTGDKPYCDKAKAAHTRLLTLERGLYDGYPATKVLLKPITGRRHQLRLHCSILGHTIVGDFTYSDRKDLTPYRMFLHSHRLVLPTNLEQLDVNAGDPFAPDCHWKPIECLNPLDQDAYLILDTLPSNLRVE